MDITGTARGIGAQPLMTKGACRLAPVLFVIEPIKHRACRTDVTKLGTSRDVHISAQAETSRPVRGISHNHAGGAHKTHEDGGTVYVESS